MTHQHITSLKADMRREMRLRRQSEALEEQSGIDHLINQSVTAYVHETGVARLCAFWPFDGEPDLRPALEKFSAGGIKVGLPVLQPDASMIMRHWHPQCAMQTNRFGIPEPHEEAQIAARDLDLMLIPLLAWDAKGGRLGMGGGYYDRFLETLRDSDTPLRMGVAYGFQEVSVVTVDEHDILLHGLFCEHGWTMFDTHHRL